MVILSVDLGKVRTGLAICDKSEILASPLPLIKQTNREKLAISIDEMCKSRNAELIVLGLPKNMDGSEGDSAKSAREFAQMLKEITNLPIEFMDERGSTITAHNYLSLNDVRGKKRKETVDSVSAVIILEDFLRKRKNTSI